MTPLEMPKNFRLCSIFPIHNLIHELVVGASLTSLNLGFKCVVSNLDSNSRIDLEMAKKDEQRNKHKLYEGSMKFQDTWMTKLPWVESMFDEKGEVQQVRCKVYTFVKRK
jgi:hypothetical protein